jgi:hypothetical protein
MRLIALEIPDDPVELAGWLERHLVGPDLAALVAELEAVHGRPGGAGVSVRGLLGRDVGAVLDAGLSSLPAPTLAQFLRRPRLLLDLQELVLTSGGEHWDRLAREVPAELAAMVERGRLKLLESLPIEARPAPILRRTRPRSLAWAVVLAAAASILIGVIALRNRGPVAPGPAWGWARPGALAADLPRDAYLARLADEAGEWFGGRPEVPIALPRRIIEFRQGCSTLIHADLTHLPAKDRDWLVGKCGEWAKKLDTLIVEVEAPGDPAKVQLEADEIVRKLIAALRDRASRPA